MSELTSAPETSTGGDLRGDDRAVAMDAYDYGLPPDAVAQHPVEPRSAARLLVGPGLRGRADVSHASVADLPGLLGPGDVVVVNDTRVLAGRLDLVKASGGRAEVLLLEPVGEGATVWEAVVRPGRRLPEGTPLFEPSADGHRDETAGPVVAVGGPADGSRDGRRLVQLIDPSVVERRGSMPLPPYIHGGLDDPERYQTVYARWSEMGDQSAAAPTAGLHFTPELLDACRRRGAIVAPVELVIGLDTFRPITAPTPDQHRMHSERYSVPAATMAACASADRVVAIGTTVVRALESAAATGSLCGRTDLYIRGAYAFQVVDALVTNFHLPRSSLLLLVEAFCGPVWRELYQTALADGYRFLSFGDAMMVRRVGSGGSG